MAVSTDPVMERYRAIQCPEGARAEIVIETGEVGCFTPAGQRVDELRPAAAAPSLGIVGWAAVGSALVALSAVLIRWRR